MLTDIEKELLNLVTSLRAENAGLQEIIFRQQGLLDEKVIVPEGSGAHIGKEPWYLKKKKLENFYRLHTDSSISPDLSVMEEPH